MKVQRYDLSATPRLHGAYERLAEGARLCYPVLREEFVRGATYRGPWGRSDLQPETIIAVERAGEIVAFPQLGEAPPQDGGRPCGVVRFFVYPRGERELGDAVLHALAVYFDECGLGAGEAYLAGYTYRPCRLGGAACRQRSDTCTVCWAPTGTALPIGRPSSVSLLSTSRRPVLLTPAWT